MSAAQAWTGAGTALWIAIKNTASCSRNAAAHTELMKTMSCCRVFERGTAKPNGIYTLLSSAVLNMQQKRGYASNWVERELYNRQRSNIILGTKKPVVVNAFVSPSSIIVGDVDVDDKASVWNNCVVRGDGNYIRIKAYANLQDKVIVSTSRFE